MQARGHTTLAGQKRKASKRAMPDASYDDEADEHHVSIGSVTSSQILEQSSIVVYNLEDEPRSRAT